MHEVLGTDVADDASHVWVARHCADRHRQFKAFERKVDVKRTHDRKSDNKKAHITWPQMGPFFLYRHVPQLTAINGRWRPLTAIFVLE